MGTFGKKTDEEILKQYKIENPWGLACSVDLKGCNAKKIRSAKVIKDFIIQLCDLIEMKRFGEPIIVDFGEDPRVSGFSMVQLIETSLISGHFANQTNAVYLDIFSCKEYSPRKMAEFCKKYFDAESYEININFRK